MRTILVCAALALLGCGKDDPSSKKEPAKEPAAPREVPPDPEPAAKPPATPPASPNQVDLVFEGGVDAKLQGQGGTCAEGLGASFRVRSEELGVTPAFELSILVTSEEEWTNPAIVLDVAEPRGNWGRNKDKPPAGETIDLARDRTQATIDTVLQPIGGGEPVKVKGTIKCPPAKI